MINLKMDAKKEFKILSIFMIALGIVDIFSIATGYLSEDVSIGNHIFLIILFAVIVLIALAKLYMGVMGLKYSKGTGKGKLHITLAKIGVALTVIATIISVIEMISGTGTIQTVINDVIDISIIYWYLQLAQKNYA